MKRHIPLFEEFVQEKQIYYTVYSNNNGESMNVYENGDLGKSPSSGFYVEVDNQFDLEFKNKKELDSYIKKNKYKVVGADKIFLEEKLTEGANNEKIKDWLKSYNIDTSWIKEKNKINNEKRTSTF